jgi:hypothetical protein
MPTLSQVAESYAGAVTHADTGTMIAAVATVSAVLLVTMVTYLMINI